LDGEIENIVRNAVWWLKVIWCFR